jgi:hypothetical protein
VSTEGLTIKTVFVLGAGFTHAFFPKAPLLTDDYAGELLAKFEKLPHARRILELEQSKNPEGKINIERLLTRLDGKMPYDFKSSVQEELALLLSELKLAFLRRLEEAKDEKSHIDELQSLARYCIDKRINCLTFNYDDFFDQSLWDVHKPTFIGPPHKPYWHPDGGYGFFCRPSTDCIMESHSYMDQTAMLLLKLHGSVNWRPKRGAATPYGIDSIVHHETWLDPPVPDSWPHTKTAIETFGTSAIDCSTRSDEICFDKRANSTSCVVKSVRNTKPGGTSCIYWILSPYYRYSCRLSFRRNAPESQSFSNSGD